jgi:UDP-N-acetylmuramate dehydrogenase
MLFQQNTSISHLSNYKTPARARYFYEISDMNQIDELKQVFHYIKQNNLKHLIIWWGTNLLFAFDVFDGIIIKNALTWWSYDKQTMILESYANEPIRKIAESLEIDHNQSLWHRFIWLPGSIGGAVFWNAGCFGLESEGNFVEAKVLNKETWEIEILTKPQMHFSYRSSILKETENYFLISAKFDLSKKVEKYHSDVDNIDFRENKQPKGNSCGSFFKNPEGVIIETNSGEEIVQDRVEIEQLKREGMITKKFSAGYLIEKVGLKGFTYGGWKWSELHANFLLSDGETCKWQDLIYLIQEAQKRVEEIYDIWLENEVRIIRN